MSFDSDEFYRFSKTLRIDSKERGLLSLGDNLIGSQRRILEEIRLGLQEGVHEFLILKSRQLGSSTLGLAIDLYWTFKHQAMNGALVTHDEGARDAFRTTLALYRAGLPDEWTREVVDDNRNQLVLENGSRLRFLVAGTTKRGASKLGRSGALVFCHSTECAFWGDASNIDSLRSSFAEHNPDRFFLWESTGNGFNHYNDMWEEAKKATTQRAIFASFWANEFNRAQRGGEIFETYWGRRGRLTAEEKMWISECRKLYDVEIDAEQVAWYRWMGAEKITDASMLAQEFPWTEHQAFIETGSQFFRSLSIGEAIRNLRSMDAPATYRVETGHNFWDTRVIPQKGRQATLAIWEEPVEGAQYVVGCDPAYASSEMSDQSVVSVWRCWYNRLEQVAEYSSREIATHACAWIFCYLAGYYGRSATNLELNGPGIAVLQEIQNLRRQASSNLQEARGEGVRQVVKHMRQYLYRRIDTYAGAAALHSKTTQELKERMMNALRDNFERGILVVRSAQMIEEMKGVVRDGSSIGAPASKKDDRVCAAALAVLCWNDQLRTELLSKRSIWIPPSEVEAQQKKQANESPIQRAVGNYLNSVGLLPQIPGIPPPVKKTAIGQVPWRNKPYPDRV